MTRSQPHAKDHGREHETIVTAVHALERALASPAPGREAVWKQRTSAALSVILDELREHVQSTEAVDGIIGQLEATLGRPHDVYEAITQHKNLLADATALLRDLTEGSDSLSCTDVRKRGHALARAIRDHQALVADLILEAFDEDIGTGD